MKVGMNLLLWTDRPTASEHGPLLKEIAGWGFDGVEFPVAGMTSDDCRQLGRLCDELGLGRTAILAFGADLADPISPDPRLRQAGLDQIRGSIDKTRDLGADILVGPIFQGLGRFTGKPPTRQEWNWSVDVLRQSAKHAAALHVDLALEPLNRFEMYLVNTIADGSRFCEAVGMPNVGLLADTHHSNIEEEKPAAAWEAHARRIVHVHVSENHRGIPGSGHACTPDIFAVLRRSGYDRWLTIEAFGQKVDSLIMPLHLWRPFFERERDVAVGGLDHIRRCWEQAGRG